MYFYMNCLIRFFNEDFKNIGKEFTSVVINDVINFETQVSVIFVPIREVASNWLITFILNNLRINYQLAFKIFSLVKS